MPARNCQGKMLLLAPRAMSAAMRRAARSAGQHQGRMGGSRGRGHVGEGDPHPVELDGDRLSDDELTMFLNQLLIAGNETTRNTISGGLVALARHPEQWDRLVDDPTLVPSAVEEILRWTTAVIYFMRTAAVDTELGGVAVSAGDPVVMVYASANLDPDEFGPTAGDFDVARSPNHHVAFGFGAHFCLGAALARLEVAAVLDALLARGITRLELAGEVERSASNVIAGVTAAPMVLRAG